MPFIGEIAALGTACCWSMGSMFFDAAGRRLGALTVNKIRIPLAVVFLAAALWVTTGRPLPPAMELDNLFWLSLSGLVGLVLGDACFFTSLVILGPRRATLLMSAAPVFTSLLAWPLLGDTLGPLTLFGMAVAISGIAWVSVEKRAKSPVQRPGSLWNGALWGLGGAAGQAAGLVLAKLGMGNEVTALTATFYRMAAATVLIWLFTILLGGLPQTIHSLRNRRGIIFAAGGAFIGPFLGVWLSLVAISHTETGIAATIMAAVPVMVIPLEVIVYHERPSPRGLLGALVTIAGVAILFLR